MIDLYFAAVLMILALVLAALLVACIPIPMPTLDICDEGSCGACERCRAGNK